MCLHRKSRGQQQRDCRDRSEFKSHPGIVRWLRPEQGVGSLHDQGDAEYDRGKDKEQGVCEQ